MLVSPAGKKTGFMQFRALKLVLRSVHRIHLSNPIIFLSLFRLIEMLTRVADFFEFEYLLATKAGGSYQLALKRYHFSCNVSRSGVGRQVFG